MNQRTSCIHAGKIAAAACGPVPVPDGAWHLPLLCPPPAVAGKGLIAQTPLACPAWHSPCAAWGVTQVVEPQSLSLKELLSYNGEDSEKPIYLAIKGTVFDVTKGKLPLGLALD